MKIGVPSENGHIFFRLERAREVTFYVVSDGRLRRTYTIPTSNGVLPLLMREEVDLVICSMLSMPTERELSVGAIRVHSGSYGDCDAAVEKVLKILEEEK